MNYQGTCCIIKKLIGLILVLSFVLTACGPTTSADPAQPNDKLAEILARGTLVIATDPNYPPFSSLNPNEARAQDTKCSPSQYTANQFSGFDAATGIAIAQRLQVEPCFVTPPWSQIISGNWANNWDINVGSMSITYERMEVLYFSQPYFATTEYAFVYSSNTTYQRPEDLSGKRIGVCSGCTYENYLRGNLNLPGMQITYRIQNPNIIAYENEIPAFEALLAGDGVNLDAVITQYSTGMNLINAGQPIRMIPEPLYNTYASVIIDKKNSRDPARFVARVNDIIREMHQDGTLSSLSRQWLGLDTTMEAAKFEIDALDQFP